MPVLVRALVQVVVGALARGREAAAIAGEAGGHEGSAAQDEADGAPVDADGGEGLGEAVDEAKVGDEGGSRVLLVEERGAVLEDVETGAVGQLHLGEGGLLGEGLVDVGGEEGVRRQQGLAEGPLDRRLELLLGRWGEAFFFLSLLLVLKTKSVGVGRKGD